jgi:hypothetical protein
MLEHFREHRQEDKDMTLWAFLCMHYDYAAKPDEDYAKDMTLPFKANDSMINATIADFVLLPFTFLQRRRFTLHLYSLSRLMSNT